MHVQQNRTVGRQGTESHHHPCRQKTRRLSTPLSTRAMRCQSRCYIRVKRHPFGVESCDALRIRRLLQPRTSGWKLPKTATSLQWTSIGGGGSPTRRHNAPGGADWHGAGGSGGWGGSGATRPMALAAAAPPVSLPARCDRLRRVTGRPRRSRALWWTLTRFRRGGLRNDG